MDKWASVIVIALLVGAAVGAYALGGHELASMLAGFAGGILMPSPVQR